MRKFWTAARKDRDRFACGPQFVRSRFAVGSRRVRLRADAAGFVASRCLSRTCRPARGAGAYVDISLRRKNSRQPGRRTHPTAAARFPFRRTATSPARRAAGARQAAARDEAGRIGAEANATRPDREPAANKLRPACEPGSHAGRSLFAAGSRSGRVAFASAPMRPASSRAAACLAPAARRSARGAGRGARGVRRYFPTPQKFQAAGPPHAPDGGRPISFSPHGNKPRAPPCTRPGACASVRRRIDRHARCCLRAPRRATRGHGDRACFRRSIDTSPTAASRRASTPAPGAAKRAAPRRPTDTERES
ncbi:Uncharacterised protein [Burkholderia pseudomallei]|nr:Uncharacterised protein [Burkholderia pseudomallei]